MKINSIALVAWLFASSFALAVNDKPATSAIAHLEPQKIIKQCHDPEGIGPIGVVRSIVRPEGELDSSVGLNAWEEILEKISQGDAQWIRASACFAHGASNSGCAACGPWLKAAWGYALMNNTRAVLEMHQWTSIEEACKLPFFEEDEAFLAQYMDKTLANLQALTTTPEDYNDVLQSARRLCTWNLKATYLDPNRCKSTNEGYSCPEVKQECLFNGDAYYNCKSAE